MIALLFALLTAALLSIWWHKLALAYGFFAVTILLSIYWLSYHATSKLTIQL